MSAKYNVIPKKNPRDQEAPRKYYPSFVTSGRVSLRQLSRQIAEVSTVSSVDTIAVLEALLTIIPREIANGNIVELGDFGTFRLRIKTEGADTAEAVTSRNITQAMPRFMPGKESQKSLNDVTFEKIKSAS